MIVSTAPFIAGHRVVETKGQTFGLVVRSRGFSGNLIAGLRSLAGGEIHEYTQLLEDTRRQALDRLVQNATLMGANAVISMRCNQYLCIESRSGCSVRAVGVVVHSPGQLWRMKSGSCVMTSAASHHATAPDASHATLGMRRHQGRASRRSNSTHAPQKLYTFSPN